MLARDSRTYINYSQHPSGPVKLAVLSKFSRYPAQVQQCRLATLCDLAKRPIPPFHPGTDMTSAPTVLQRQAPAYSFMRCR